MTNRKKMKFKIEYVNTVKIAIDNACLILIVQDYIRSRAKRLFVSSCNV